MVCKLFTFFPNLTDVNWKWQTQKISTTAILAWQSLKSFQEDWIFLYHPLININRSSSLKHIIITCQAIEVNHKFESKCKTFI